MATTDYDKVLEGAYQLNFTEHAGDLNSVHTFEIELMHPCLLIPMNVSGNDIAESVTANYGEDYLTISIPPLTSVCKDLTVEATLDGQSIEDVFEPYV